MPFLNMMYSVCVRVSTRSMWVFDQHVVGTILAPLKAKTPLVVDAHMPSAVVLLQIVTWRSFHKIHRGRRIELGELTLGYALDICEPAALARGEQGFCVIAGKRLDRHINVIC